MAREFIPKLVTASDLLEGDVIYLKADNAWSRKIADAMVFVCPEYADCALSVAEAQADRVVGPYLADVKLDEDGDHLPAHFREAFRMTGPSNYFHGKQAEA